MIVATVALLMIWFGGGMFSFEKAYEPFLKEAIAEESRYEQTIQLTKEADEAVKQYRKEVSDVWVKELKTLLADYDTTDEQFRAFYEKGAVSRTAMQQHMLDVRFEMTRIVTRDEWNAVYGMMDQKVEENRKKAEEQKE